MEEQSDRLGKLALCVSSCILAKENLIEEEGIGEDLPFTLFGWRGSSLAIVAQLHSSLMKEEQTERLSRLYFCASMFRMGWAVDAMTFMAEAYCSDNPDETFGSQLDVLFASGNMNVSECITFTHVDENQISLVLAPYKIGLGRKVEWKKVVHQDEAKGLRDSAYLQLLTECLSLDVRESPLNAKEYHDHLIYGLESKGFSIDLLIAE